jgi:uncharacterized protein DUF262
VSLEIQRIGSRVYQQPMGMIVSSYILRGQDDDLLSDPWVLDPPFQRGSVWTLKQKRAWIETLLHGFSLPSIFINRFPHEHPVYGFREVVIDGQQRLRATAEFMRDKFKVRGETYSEQTIVFRRQWEMSGTNVPVVMCQFKTDKECAELYVKLLQAGTAHTSAEIKKAKDFIKGCE